MIGESVGKDVVLVSSADETAFAVAESLEKRNLKTTSLNQGKKTFISSEMYLGLQSKVKSYLDLN